MKTTLLITLLLSMTVANAQEFELNEKGAYERQEVIQVEGATAVQLYDRAMIALSDWTGSDGKAKVGIDYQNQETHTLIYKGMFYLGYKRVIINGWDRYGNFTLRIRCKDGRVQLTLTVPTVTCIYDKDGTTKVYGLPEVLGEKEKAGKKKKERMERLIDNLKNNADTIFVAMGLKLKGDNSDDDF